MAGGRQAQLGFAHLHCKNGGGMEGGQRAQLKFAYLHCKKGEACHGGSRHSKDLRNSLRVGLSSG